MTRLLNGMTLALALSLGLFACATVSAQEADAAAKQEEAKPADSKAERDSQPEAGAKGTTAAPAASDAKGDAEKEHAKSGDAGHAEGGHTHDPYDNTHANPSSTLSRADEMRFDLAIATFCVFALLAIILAKFAWGPISEGLDKREQGIAQMIDDAKMAQQQAEAQLRSYEAKLAAAAEEARAMVAQARADADATRERELAATKAENEKLLQRNKDEIEAAKNAALQQIAEKSVNTAISLASNIVRREVKPEDHDALVTDALSKFTKLN